MFGQNCFIVHLDNNAILPHPSAYLQSNTSGWTCKDDKLNGEFGWSAQLNLTSKRHWFQNAFQQNLSGSLWNVQVWTADQVKQLKRWPWKQIPLPASWRLNANSFILLNFDVENHIAGITIIDGQKGMLYSDNLSIEGFAITPRLADLAVGGFGGGSIATFNGFVAGASVSTSASKGASFKNFKLAIPFELPQKIADISWFPTQESSNLKQVNPTLGSQNLSFKVTS